ncbi:hypothetical protein AB6A40_000945 [Gnathostoma spinigerum]|uniref:Xrn1 helical domain-containing protein n=1 Tax=Gnathostoma spinigerum TaxID=75299 RepID=A0ABD6E591_9BILA
MGVFPAASRSHLPESWQSLMVENDSPIIDFYPSDFKVDLNGKKFAWQGVALLPFVDEKRLLETLDEVERNLTDSERERNSIGADRIFVGPVNPLASFLKELIESGKVDAVELDPTMTNGMAGCVRIDKKAVSVTGAMYCSPIPSNSCPNISVNNAVMTIYQDPQFEKGFIFPAKRLPGAKEIPRTLKPSDFDNSNQYRPQIGFSREVPHARLGDPGHRMLGREVSRMAVHSGHGEQFSSGRINYERRDEFQREVLLRRDGREGYRGHNSPPWHRNAQSYNGRGQLRDCPQPVFSRNNSYGPFDRSFDRTGYGGLYEQPYSFEHENLRRGGQYGSDPWLPRSRW